MVASFEADSEGFWPPNGPPEDRFPPKIPPPVALVPALFSAGGGPAGVVEFAKVNRLPGFDVAGVVDPAGAEDDGVAAPNVGTADVLLVLSCEGFSAPLVAGAEFSFFSSGFFPKVNPVLPPKMLDAPVVLLVPLNNPRVCPPLALPVLAPNSEGVVVPEVGVEAVFDPKIIGF